MKNFVRIWNWKPEQDVRQVSKDIFKNSLLGKKQDKRIFIDTPHNKNWIFFDGIVGIHEIFH